MKNQATRVLNRMATLATAPLRSLRDTSWEEAKSFLISLDCCVPDMPSATARSSYLQVRLASLTTMHHDR
jgi:hypothetical protein